MSEGELRPRGESAETRRMRGYTRMYWEKEVPVLKTFGLRDGLSVVELGSGPGIVTDLLLRLLPGLTITSIEHREEAVVQARAYLRDRGHSGVRIVQADVLETTLPDNAFDFAYARLVFRYLPEPLGAIREAVRLLKPGGILVISDIDLDLWGLFEPPIPELKPALDAYGRMLAARRGDARIGRRLVRLLEVAGLTRTGIEAVATTSADLAEGSSMGTFLAPIGLGRLERMVQGGWLTAQEGDHARNGWKRFLASPSPFVLKVMLVAGGARAEAD
ncbi:MAG: methyltransferase domain-containing protein [Candidatus Thermoplasmatota archaeon]|nr:methyltransferase domain-containing protein [Candidatus Thermoplasmatota archaeon]